MNTTKATRRRTVARPYSAAIDAARLGNEDKIRAAGASFPPLLIEHEGEVWKLLGTGSVRDGKVYCHLSSTTRGRYQKNGWYPLGMCDWIDKKVLLSLSGETP